MTRADELQSAARMTRVWTPLTSFTGRAADVTELTRLLENCRLVTVTGPGGVGKTRLAAEVARQVTDQFPDGVWFIELGAVTDAAYVPTEVMSALGVQQHPGAPPLEALAEVLAPRRLLLILDNCEHVLPAVAGLCRGLLGSGDEVRVLATSRERIGITEETRYRLSPLELPASDAPSAAGGPGTVADPAAVAKSAAAALFIDRALQADRRFTVSPDNAPLIARIVTRLDGMPLAIELAAARVEALGVAGLADRIDDALRLLTGKDPLSAKRHRSLAALADWSYQLLTEPEQRVFRRLAAFPGPFTLEAAEAVAGPGAGQVVLRLVDCSLVAPPRTGTDLRMRYTMLQTLRMYALTRLTEAGEERQAAAALTAFAESVAGQAAAGLATSCERELCALRLLDAEDAMLSHALTWAREHDPGSALRLATTLFPWFRLRGRLAEAQVTLSEAITRSSATGETWAWARNWLGFLSSDFDDADHGESHHTAVIEAHRGSEPLPVTSMALASRAMPRLNRGDIPGAVDDARRALAVAIELDDTASELLALASLSVVACHAGDTAEAMDWALRAWRHLSPDVPGWLARWCHYALTIVLTEIGDLHSARRVCTAGMTLARQVDDLVFLNELLGEMGDLERLAGNLADAGAYLRQGIVLATQIGHRLSLGNLIEQCGYLCAAAGRPADAVTLWAAYTADQERHGRPTGAVIDRRRAEYLPRIRQTLDPGQFREAQERGASMRISAAAELAVMATTVSVKRPEEPAAGTTLSPRERELVTLVARGRTNTEIAAGLHISVRTVASHLDRIRDKTGYRRRADLTRLAVEENLV